MRFTEFISEAGSPAQQAAIAIAMKKAGKKPKSVAEGDQIDEVFADQGSGSTDRDNADYMKRRRAANKAAEAEKNPHTSALGRALYRDLSKEKKASPQQVQRNKERWAQRQAEREQSVAEAFDSAAFDRHMDKLRAQKKLEKTDPMRALVNKMHSDDAHAAKMKRRDPSTDDDTNIHSPFHSSQSVNIGEQGVAEGSKMLSLDDKIKIYSKHKSQARQAENRGDYTTADKHKKQASKIYSNIVNLHFGDDSKDAQNAANEYIRKSQGVAEEKKPEFMKSGNMKPFKVSGEEIPGAVHTLEKLLLKAKERDIKLNYTNIDKMMQSVCKKHNLTGDELHNEFVEKNHMIPDDWIVKQLDEACWSTHKQVGMKNKGGKQVPNCVPKESTEATETEQVLENLHKWFKEKWVRFGPDGKIRGDCARGSESEGKPKCLPQSKAHSLGKKGRASAAARKRREDPNANRSGKAINVSTKGKGK